MFLAKSADVIDSRVVAEHSFARVRKNIKQKGFNGRVLILMRTVCEMAGKKGVTEGKNAGKRSLNDSRRPGRRFQWAGKLGRRGSSEGWAPIHGA